MILPTQRSRKVVRFMQNEPHIFMYRAQRTNVNILKRMIFLTKINISVYTRELLATFNLLSKWCCDGKPAVCWRHVARAAYIAPLCKTRKSSTRHV